MSDPFSVAGSAVGVISLGLQVCSKIVSYTQAVRGQNNDIQHLATKAQDVRSSLESLNELIKETKDDSSVFANNLESRMLCLRSYVERLDAKVEQYKPVVTESLHGRARSTLKKSSYPLKRESLFEIGNCLNDMQETLQTELAIFTARDIRKVGLKQDSFDIKQEQLLEEMKTLQLSLTNPALRTLLQQPPSRVKEWCDRLSDESWLTSLPRAPEGYKSKRAKRRFRYHNTWLGVLVTGTFSLPTGSGGSSIAPFLRFTNVLGRGSLFANMIIDAGIYSADEESRRQHARIWDEIDILIQTLQYAFSTGNAAPTDLLSMYQSRCLSNGPISIIALPFYAWHPSREDSPNVNKFIRYMLFCGATLDYDSSSQLLVSLINSYLWTEAELLLIPYLLERIGPVNRRPSTWEGKRNMQEMLRRDEYSVDLPAADKAIIRESYEELNGIIKSDNSIDRVPLLQLAMGWPAGLELLLQKSSKTEIPSRYHYGLGLLADDSSEIYKYAKSCNLLFRAEYPFSLLAAFLSHSSRIQFIFLREYANRQRKLLEIANAHIPHYEISEIRKEETGLPDRQANQLCNALMAKGIEVDQFLRPLEIAPLYSNLHILSSDLVEKAYEFGFTDVTQQLPEGYTPLAFNCTLFTRWDSRSEFLIVWLISKGASPLERLPRSYTTVAHLRSSKLGMDIYSGFRIGKHLDLTWVTLKASGLEKTHQIIESLQLSALVTDECSCPCSVGGCTTLSVAIRRVINKCLRPAKNIADTAVKFREFLQFLIEYNQSTSHACRSIIRSLTFDGLGLNHSCCIECHHMSPWEHTREECELVEIREEQKTQFQHHESLVAEFERQFDTYGLPLVDFLRKVWYERMIRFLSHSDPFDTEHHEESRELNVFLRRDEVEIPFVVQVICDQTRVIEEDSKDSC